MYLRFKYAILMVFAFFTMILCSIISFPIWLVTGNKNLVLWSYELMDIIDLWYDSNKMKW